MARITAGDENSSDDDSDSDGARSRSPRRSIGGSFQDKYGGAGGFGLGATAESQLESMLASAGAPGFGVPAAAPPSVPPAVPASSPGPGFSGVLGAGGKGLAGKGALGGDHQAMAKRLAAAGMTIPSEPKVETTAMDFSKISTNLTNYSVTVSKKLVEHLMTPDHRRLLTEETGCNVEWAPGEAKVNLGGSPEQVKRAQRLLARVMMHCKWGYSESKVRRLLKPRAAESVLCRLSPMNTLRPVEKVMTQAQALISIGKDKTNDVTIQDALVSRQHCVLELDPDRGAVYVLDCSTNGTFLNGVRLPSKQAGKVLLSHGDELLLKDPKSGEQEFGYIINLTELVMKQEMKLEAPRRILTADEMGRGELP